MSKFIEIKIEPLKHIILTKLDGSTQVLYGSYFYELEMRFSKHEDLGMYFCWVCINDSYLEHIDSIKYFEIKENINVQL